ncbi:hypothetical protein PJU73_07525 [Neisseria lisongii]|uniref:ABC transporter n=1 Tax=Neisseria lisongii TaxID=2912188 RepID=A0ABY7RK78_9NEIS|nr:hypothetical protein [Neisseria lisongii]WCL71181.1 hypothetical protein PJU73_07525 [Neisseria lisongii]
MSSHFLTETCDYCDFLLKRQADVAVFVVFVQMPETIFRIDNRPSENAIFRRPRFKLKGK